MALTAACQHGLNRQAQTFFEVNTCTDIQHIRSNYKSRNKRTNKQASAFSRLLNPTPGKLYSEAEKSRFQEGRPSRSSSQTSPSRKRGYCCRLTGWRLTRSRLIALPSWGFLGSAWRTTEDVWQVNCGPAIDLIFDPCKSFNMPCAFVHMLMFGIIWMRIPASLGVPPIRAKYFPLVHLGRTFWTAGREPGYLDEPNWNTCWWWD